MKTYILILYNILTGFKNKVVLYCVVAGIDRPKAAKRRYSNAVVAARAQSKSFYAPNGKKLAGQPALIRHLGCIGEQIVY